MQKCGRDFFCGHVCWSIDIAPVSRECFKKPALAQWKRSACSRIDFARACIVRLCMRVHVLCTLAALGGQGGTREAMACTHSFTTGAQGLGLCYRAYTILQLWTTAFSGWVKRCKTMFCQLSLPFPHRLLYYSVQLRTKTFRTQSCASTTRFVIARQEAVFSNLCLCGCHQISGILLENGSRTSHLM